MSVLFVSGFTSCFCFEDQVVFLVVVVVCGFMPSFVGGFV